MVRGVLEVSIEGLIDNYTKQIICGYMFNELEGLPVFTLLDSNNGIDEACAGDYRDLKCLFEDIFGMDEAYFKALINGSGGE